MTEPLPKVLLITGHGRSGTTMLNRLCNSHPNIRTTIEFHTFVGLNQPLIPYVSQLRRNFTRFHTRPRPEGSGARRFIRDWAFYWRYVGRLLPHARQIDLNAVRQALGGIFPQAQVVGDKFPRYIDSIERYVNEPNLYRVVIYRDARDVVSSVLEMVATRWAGRPHAREWGTPANFAKTWVRAIDNMQAYAEHLHIIRYESLMRQPEVEVARLADYLGVAATGFNFSFIDPTRVGKHRSGLTAAQIEVVNHIAGPTMAALGYQLEQGAEE